MGALLRSGKTDTFTALGETGRPVYRAALQLREAIKRKHPGLADHFAIPQSNQIGDQIDWYAAFEGEVIPWTAATEEERAPARATLEEVRATLKLMSTTLLDPSNGEAQGDRQVLARLLTRVMNFPDESFVYLVGGKPVMTFWGFDHHRAPLNRNALQCLYPGATPVVPAAPIVAAPLVDAPPVSPVIVQPRRPWWHWLLLGLLLALLLALLLFGLRACGPQLGINIPGFTLPVAVTPAVPDATLRQPLAVVPDTAPSGVALAPATSGAITTQGSLIAPGAGLGPQSSGNVPLTPPGVDLKSPSMPAPDTTKGDPISLTPPGLTPPDLNAPGGSSPDLTSPGQTPGHTAADKTSPGATPPGLIPPQGGAGTSKNAGAPLAMPANLPDGNAKFLNGNWRAGAGIQDARTGQPLRLDYQFNDGKGNVTVQRGDGVACSAPVTATMKGGTLGMTSAEQATCGDGTKYEMPQIACKPGAQSIADCNGTYGKDQFPLSMRQATK